MSARVTAAERVGIELRALARRVAELATVRGLDGARPLPEGEPGARLEADDAAELGDLAESTAALSRRLWAGRPRALPRGVDAAGLGVLVDVSPGNGTRYQLSVTRWPGGGWLVVWPATGWVGGWTAGAVDLRDLAGGIGDVDARVVLDLLVDLYAAGALEGR